MLCPVPFRYSVTTAAKSCIFEPKPAAGDLMDCRPTIFGACFLEGGLSKLPSSEMASTIWEEASTHGVCGDLLSLTYLPCLVGGLISKRYS